jgi:hypothetical protein
MVFEDRAEDKISDACAQIKAVSPETDCYICEWVVGSISPWHDHLTVSHRPTSAQTQRLTGLAPSTRSAMHWMHKSKPPRSPGNMNSIATARTQ